MNHPEQSPSELLAHSIFTFPIAWNVRRLVELSKAFPVKTVVVAKIAELNENHWYQYGDSLPTCQSIIEHIKLIDIR